MINSRNRQPNKGAWKGQLGSGGFRGKETHIGVNEVKNEQVGVYTKGAM